MNYATPFLLVKHFIWMQEYRCHITVIDNGSVMYMLLQPDDEHSISDHFQIKCSFFSKWKPMYMCHSCLWRTSHWWKTKHGLCRFTTLLVTSQKKLEVVLLLQPTNVFYVSQHFCFRLNSAHNMKASSLMVFQTSYMG